MLTKNSNLIIGGFFFLLGFYAYRTDDLIGLMICLWFGIAFSFFWLLHFLKVNFSIDWGRCLVRDSFLKYFLISVVVFPYLFVKYLSLFMQSLREKPITQVTDHIFIGQQLLWFHQRIFKANKLSAVLDVTVENVEPLFISTDKTIHFLRVPVLDKTSPSVSQLEGGVRWGLDQIAAGKNLYVHCAAGHERSATFVSAILLKLGICKTIEEAMALIKQKRPKVRFVGDQKIILERWLAGN